MRVFETLQEAIPEIRRDLGKSPTVKTSRVQHLEISDFVAREAMNYGYTILGEGIPDDPQALMKIWQDEFPEFVGRDGSTLQLWLQKEIQSRVHSERFYAGGAYTDSSPESLHPTLQNMLEGNHVSYSYRERLVGAVDQICYALLQNPDSRRVYWPIFREVDALRSADLTRIPCSLGYQLMIRDVPGQGPRLHLTYISRSCDFDKYWISDIWFANKFQRAILRRLTLDWDGRPGVLPELKLGGTSHFILSLHRFEDADEELF